MQCFDDNYQAAAVAWQPIIRSDDIIYRQQYGQQLEDMGERGL